MHIILFSLKCFHLLSGCMDKAVQDKSLYQLRNLNNRRSVVSDVSNNMNSWRTSWSLSQKLISCNCNPSSVLKM